MKLVNNNISPLPFYDALSFQNHRKSYAFGQVYSLITYKNMLLPFQVIIDKASWSITSAVLIDFNTGAQAYNVLSSMVNNGLQIKQFDNCSIIKYPGNNPVSFTLKEGRYYLRIRIHNNDSARDYDIYSDVITVTNRVDSYILLEYSNSYNLQFKDGVVDFSGNFKFRCYLSTQIGRPEYYFEEEATERMGYTFIEAQVSKKIYKFTFLAPEYLCDALRIVRLCETKKITANNEEYSLTTFAMDPEWQEQGDVAAVVCEFETDTVIANIGGYAVDTSGGGGGSAPGGGGGLGGVNYLYRLYDTAKAIDSKPGSRKLLLYDPTVIDKDNNAGAWTYADISDITSNLFIGTTKVQAESKAQALTGITNLTMSGTLNLGDAKIWWDRDKKALRTNCAFITAGDQIVIDGDPSEGGGSGGGALYLHELLDVNENLSPKNGDLLYYNGKEWTSISQDAIKPDLSGYYTKQQADNAISEAIKAFTNSYFPNGKLSYGFIPDLFIGTTKVQHSSAAQALTGITNLTMSGTLNISSAKIWWDDDKKALRTNCAFITAGDQIVIDGDPSEGGTTGGVRYLRELEDVNINEPLSDNQALVYDAKVGKFVNKNISAGAGTVTSITVGTTKYDPDQAGNIALPKYVVSSALNGLTKVSELVVCSDYPSSQKSGALYLKMGAGAVSDFSGLVTAVKVGGTTYKPDLGVVDLGNIVTLDPAVSIGYVTSSDKSSKLAFITNTVSGGARIGVTDGGAPMYWQNAEGSNRQELLHTGNISSKDITVKSISVESLTVRGTVGSSNKIISDAVTNIYFSMSDGSTPLTLDYQQRAVRPGMSYSNSYTLGMSTSYWKAVYSAAFTNASDARLKNVIRKIDIDVAYIAKAPYIAFTWKDSGVVSAGSFAQYWQSIVPELVEGGEDEIMSMQYGPIALIAAGSIAKKVLDHEARLNRIERALGIDIDEQ